MVKKIKVVMKKSDGRTARLLLIFMILIANALCWCVKKEGYYIDELWSYGLSNGYYTPFLHQKEGYMNEWHQPSFYKDYLTAEQGEVFSYDSVYHNQVQDVHPPCWYMLLHTVCSLFPGRFSKWFGLSINLLFFCGAVFLLYKISELVLGERDNVKFIPPLLYGLSVGAVSTLIYIRMYMLLTFEALLLVFLAYLLIKEMVYKKRILMLAGISLTVAAGFCTQYYFVIFAFFFSAVYVSRNMIIHQWRRAVEYSFAACTGVVGGILIFPASLSHIFLGRQGKQAFRNVFADVHLFLKRWVQYMDVIIRELLGIEDMAPMLLLLLLLMITIVGYLAKKKNRRRIIWDTIPKAECLLLFVTVFCYFTLIVQISPEVTDRYQFIIYPFCVLLGVSAAIYLFRQLGKTRLIWIATAGWLALMLRAYVTQPVPYVYEGYQGVVNALGKEYKNVPGIYVTEGDHLVINNCLFLAQQNMTYPLTLEQINEIPKICEGIGAEQLILYVDIYYDEPQTAKQVAELLEYQSYFLLWDNTFTQIFVLSR